MKTTIKMLITVVLLIAPLLSSAQYFQGLYDADSSQDWGYDIFLQPDGSYFVFGTQINTTTTDVWRLFNMKISADGSTVIGKNILECANASLFIGVWGEIKKLPSGNGYVAPFTVEKIYDDTIPRGWGGILKYNNAGDTTFLKTYTDTSIYYDAFDALGFMPDGGYIIGGGHGFDTPSYYPAYVIRTDSSGDSIWTHTYQKYSDQQAVVINVVTLNDGRIVVGAMSTYQENIPGFGYIPHNSPWFLLLDSLGNVIKDTIYGSNYMVGYNCGELYSDMSGGYIYIGIYDSLFTPDPTDAVNYPCYIAHLDTNFNITWITEFPYTFEQGHRQGVIMRQLRDSSYILLGDDWSDCLVHDRGFAAKISRTGEIRWSNTYYAQITQDAYIRDMVEKTDGSLLFTGQSFDDSLPAWHQHYDMWLLGVDSNGCEIPGCNITGIKNIIQPKTLSFSVYPNPTYGPLTVNSTAGGTFELYTLEGQLISKYRVSTRGTDLTLPPNLAGGVYMGVFKQDDGGLQKTVRLIYQP